MKLMSTLTILTTLATAGVASANTALLNRDAQGGGNKGASFRPLDEFGNPVNFMLTAISQIDDTKPFDPTAAGLVGTVFIDRKGAGVQTGSGRGSKGISGGGGHRDEALVFTYDTSVALNTILIVLNDIEFGTGVGDEDDPVIFLSTAGSSSFDVTISESELVAAFSSTGRKRGAVDFSLFTSLGGGALIDSWKIRETNDHIYVDLASGSATAVPLPAPVALTLAGFGAVAARRRRRSSIVD